MAEVNPISNPTLVDKVLDEIQKGLKANLGWLDSSFGKAERIVKQINGRNYYLPAIYSGNKLHPNEYLELSPDASIGNFSFFWLMDPERMTWMSKIQGTLKTSFALIFWFDLRKVYDEKNNRNIAALEAEVLRVLNGGFLMRYGQLSINKIYHLPENIYKEFSLDNVDNQFLMHPYAGFRLEGELEYEEPCL